MKSINIDIAADGGIEIDAVGFTGPDCEHATRFLEEALGETSSKRRKPEYRRRAVVQKRQQVGTGGNGA